MFKRQGFKKLGKKASHRKSMLKNLVRSIVEVGYVTTTTVKAKVLKSEIESLLSRVSSKKVDFTLYRDLEATLGKRSSVDTLLAYLKGEKVGVRIVKTGYRAGDNAQQSKVELMGYASSTKTNDSKKEDSKKTEEPKKVVEKEKSRTGVLKNLLPGKSVAKGVAVKRERARTRSGI